MLVDFEKLSETSRVWIYQSNRSFTDAEVEELNNELNEFLNQWTAHGQNLSAAYKIEYKRFIIIGLDQKLNAATGCSIDASVHFIQHLEKKYNVELLDKMNVSYKQGEFIAYKPLSDFKKMAKEGAVSKNTVVFNNLVTNVSDFNDNWEVPASDSWHSRFFK